MREGRILRSLYETADNGDKKLVEKHFLTTICHGDVRIRHDMLDDAENTLMRGLKVAKDSGAQFKLQQRSIMQNLTRASGSERSRAATRVQDPNRSHQTYEHKTHYRIVFKEVGAAIDSMESPPLSGVMTALADIAGGAFHSLVHL
jgi:hypothetical protein